MGSETLTGRDSLSLALGLSGDTPVLHRWKRQTQSDRAFDLQHSPVPLHFLYLYMRRYFPSRPLSESETSNEQDAGNPLPCRFTSPTGGAQDSRAVRA